MLGGYARKISNMREVLAKNFHYARKDPKHLVGHGGCKHTADWNVNQEKQQRNCPASRQEGKYKLHSKGFLTNRLLWKTKERDKNFKMMECKKLVET